MKETVREPPYPPAPWQLRGVSIQASRLIDTSLARQFVPAKARVLSVMPGKTLAVVYCARYSPGSTLIYSELALAPALIRADGKTGFWISHICVDNPRSIAGGHEIWHLPKQAASFEWSADHAQVTVTQGALTLFRAELHPSARQPGIRRGVPLPLIGPVVIEAPTGFQKFWLRGGCRLSRSRGDISAAPMSPVSQLRFTGAQSLWTADALSLTVPAPPQDRTLRRP